MGAGFRTREKRISSLTSSTTSLTLIEDDLKYTRKVIRRSMEYITGGDTADVKNSIQG